MIIIIHYLKVTFPTTKFNLHLCVRPDGFIASGSFSEERITGVDVSLMDGGINVPLSSRGRSAVLQVDSSAAVWPAD